MSEHGFKDWPAHEETVERRIHDLDVLVEDLRCDFADREGNKVLRSNFGTLLRAQRQLQDLTQELGPIFAVAQ